MKHPCTLLGERQMKTLVTNVAGRARLHRETLTWTNKVGQERSSRSLQNVDIGAHGVGIGHDEFIEDAMQCYRFVLLFFAEQNEAFATRSCDILLCWARTCSEFKGSNAPLECAWGGTCFVRTAELLKYRWKGWTAGIDQLVNGFIDKILLPNLTGRYKEIKAWNNNWILTILECFQQIYIFKDDKERLNWMMKEYQEIAPRTFVGTTGKNTESDRDTIHEQFQMASHVQICEVAYKMGTNVYTDAILKSCEYIASKLNGTIPADMKAPLKDNWFMPGAWETAYNHYVKRMKRAMPETEKVLNVRGRRPERMSFNWGPGWIFQQ
jgi:hypothetical protein